MSTSHLGVAEAALAVAVLALAGGCGFDPVPRAQAPELDTGQAKCQVASGNANPLVTEWPASEKANLELRLREGGVAVAYAGCELRLIPDCHLGGYYFWQRTTVASDAFEVRSADDLYAKLPLGAVSLEGELNRSGRLAMRTTVSGQLRLTAVAAVPQGQGCGAATHVVSAMSVGAFTLRSGGALGVRAGADTPVGGIGAGTESQESMVREAGDPDRCQGATAQGAHPECASPIQLFLVPLASLAYAAAAPPPVAPPATAAPPPPVATVAPPPVATAPPSPVATTPPPLPTTTAPPPPVATVPPPPTATPTPPATAPPSAPPPASTAGSWLPPAPAGPLGPGLAAGAGSAAPADDVARLVVNVSSAEPDATFSVSAGGEALCTTPCSTSVRIDDLVAIQELGKKNSKAMTIKGLRDYGVAGAVDVTAHPRATGRFIGGVLLAAGGGMGLLGGVIALALGSSRDSVGAQVAGGIALAAGVGMIVPGILLVVGFKEHLEVSPAQGVDLSFGPGYLHGRF